MGVEPFDTARHLDNPEAISHYLAEALETGDRKAYCSCHHEHSARWPNSNATSQERKREMAGKYQTAAELRAEQRAETRQRGDEEDRQQRVMVIAEFDAGDPDATMHAMAEAILEYRRALRMLGRAVDLAKVGAPVALIGPGTGVPRRTAAPAMR